MPRKTWDIFCKVIDNFGDIGVCWRLTKQLAREHSLQVRLYVDDFRVAAKIIPTINFNNKSQLIDNIEINIFENVVSVADVVIEAFGCGLPEAYENQMKADTVWVNLEYLTAETWAEDFHGKSSDFGEGKPKRYFFYPGFTEKTGGLIREAALGNFSATENNSEELKVSLFCYSQAPIQSLLHAWANGIQKIRVFVSAESLFPAIASFFGQAAYVGATLTQGAVTVQLLSFLSQDDYDALLRSCDLNFVRGEDSWIRAIWAGKPLIWQPYVQQEDTHIAKLNAFLALFYAENVAACAAHRYWSATDSTQSFSEIWQLYLADFAAIQALTQAKSQQLSRQPDLATKLVEFCIKA